MTSFLLLVTIAPPHPPHQRNSGQYPDHNANHQRGAPQPLVHLREKRDVEGTAGSRRPERALGCGARRGHLLMNEPNQCPHHLPASFTSTPAACSRALPHMNAMCDPVAPITNALNNSTDTLSQEAITK